jgi:hypothetical protein
MPVGDMQTTTTSIISVIIDHPVCVRVWNDCVIPCQQRSSEHRNVHGIRIQMIVIDETADDPFKRLYRDH